MEIVKPLIYFDVENKNGRIYSSQEVMPKVELLVERIKKFGAFYGELGHPDNFDISLSNVSHNIQNMYEKDNVLYGKINILNTNSGKILKQNIDKFVFRPRAIGVVESDKNVKIHTLITFDAVLKEDDSFSDFVKIESKPLTIWQKFKVWIFDNFYYKYF